MILSFNARLTAVFLLGVAGLIWQAILVTTGGDTSEALVTAFSSFILASIGIGIKLENGNGNGSSSNKK